MNSTPSSTSFARSPYMSSTEHARLELGAAARPPCRSGRADCSSAHSASSRPTATTPSSSAQITSPGCDRDPPITTGTLTEPGRRLHRALARHVPAPHRESHRPEIARVADAGVDHESADPPRHQRGGEQVAEHPVRRRRGVGHDEDVARLTDLDRGVDHEVVAGVARHGHRAAGDPHVVLDRADVDAEEAAAADRLVHGGGTDRGERVDDVGGGAFDRAHHDVPVAGARVGSRVRHRTPRRRASGTRAGRCRGTPAPWPKRRAREWSM